MSLFYITFLTKIIEKSWIFTFLDTDIANDTKISQDNKFLLVGDDHGSVAVMKIPDYENPTWFSNLHSSKWQICRLTKKTKEGITDVHWNKPASY